MSSLIDKIFTIKGEQIELSHRIKARMKRSFDDAVQRECDGHFIDGVGAVFETMERLGMDGTLKIVRQRMIDDHIIEPVGIDVGEDQESGASDEEAGEDWIKTVVEMIG